MIGKEILNYTITSYIGKGGMGSVYLAEHKFIKQQKVAIKVINADMVNDFTRRHLQEEAEHLAELNHPNIVHFINYHIDETGNIYLIMEYADGISLDKYIETVSGLIVEDRICPLFEPILDAVGYAHKHHILHRDIKPSNIIITHEGIPKILDFGIAKIIKQGKEEDEENLIMGTPSYMSPEQVQGKHLGTPSDIYSLGVLLHQMLTGNAPYDTTTLTELDINKKVVEEPLPRLRTYYKYVSEKVQKVVDKAVAKKEEERYQSCEEFKKALHIAIYPPKVPKGIKISIAAAFILVIGLGIYWWDYTRTKIYYYKDYVEEWGVPVGIHELSDDEVAHRTASYRLEYRRRKLLRMSYINSKGSIIKHSTTDDIERPTDSKFYYNESGSLDYIKILDPHGKVLMVKDYINKDLNVVVFRYDDEYGTEKNLSAQTVTTFTSNMDESDAHGKVSRYLLTYDDAGHVTELKYASFQNARVCDADGLYGRKYVLDEKGRVKEEIFTGYDGQPKATKSGMAIRTREYNEADDPVRFTYLSPSYGPAGEKDLKVPVCHDFVDQYGNVIRQVYEDLDGNLTLRADCNVAGSEYTISNGLITEISYFGLDNQPTYTSSDGITGARCQYDGNGFRTEISFFGKDKQPIACNEGHYGQKSTNDIYGYSLTIVYLDSLGDPFMTNEGFAIQRNTYDEAGNTTNVSFYNAEDILTATSWGIASIAYRYDAQGRQIYRKDFDAQGNPIPAVNGEIPCVHTKYSLQGNSELVEFFNGTEDSLVLNSELIAGWKSDYDDAGNETHREFFDTHRQKTNLVNEAYVGWFATYDDQGNQLEIRYVNAQGELCNTSEGWAIKKSEYDERGNVLANYWSDAQGKLPRYWINSRYTYDEHDNLIKVSCVNAEGKPALCQQKYYQAEYTCNDRGQDTEVRYYDLTGNLTPINNDNAAIYQWKYDDRGNCIETATFDAKGKLVCRKTDKYAIARNEYDATGRIIRQSYYGTDGNPTPISQYVPEGFVQYDEWGNINYIAAGDGYGNLIINPATGWAVIRMVKNQRGKELETRYYDQYDKPMINPSSKYHLIKYVYDERNNIQSYSVYDTQEQPTLAYNVFMATYAYDEYGRKVAETYFGKNQSPANAENGIHKWNYTYDDASSNPSQRSGYDKNGNRIISQRWNGENWENISNTEPSSWQKEVREVAKNLPLDLGEDAKHLTLQSWTILNKTSTEMVFRIPESKYKTSEQDMSFYQNATDIFVQQLKSVLPSEVRLIVILKDNKDREILKYRK